MKKTTKILLTSYICAAIIVAVGCITKANVTANSYKMMLQNGYESTMTELAEYMENISLGLEKESYCGSTEQLGQLSSQICADTACAKECLERLPVSPQYTSSIYKFLSQSGDFSLYLSRKNDSRLNESEQKELNELAKYSTQLSNNISNIEALSCDANSPDYWSNEIKSILNSAENNAKAALSELNSSIMDISQSDTEYPTLIYDGPFSDHMQNGRAKLIENSPKISQNAAKTICAKLLSSDSDKLKLSSTENGQIDAYVFSCGEKTAAITQKGGKLLYMTSSREVKKQTVKPTASIEIAKRYLTQVFGGDFKESYYMINDNICTVNFANVNGDVICYPDLIKVSVALDNGEVVGLEAAGYIMNHQSRTPTFEKEENEARSRLNDSLTLESVEKCIINVNTDKEYDCYEYLCKAQNGKELLIYIDANDLTERNILILTKTPGGTLTK